MDLLLWLAGLPGRIWAAMLRAAPITAWWRFGAAVVVSLLVAGLIWIIWRGPWSAGVEAERLNWLGWFGVLLIVALLACVAFLFDRSLKVDATRSGFSLRAGDDEPAATITTTTEVQFDERPPWERKP